ncbi:apolipoprotein N-acyltransferase [Pseudoduganella violacea]|uniref:Apolipoprotein N-acyltransferase n=1 Tax=Pseudoduganella violacea TaxID=1715466 RepID=A0A7W5BF55_9BURK|nr:apolipoprotein N-acyltransferase [Pseudoduganella violacea]MBB3121833.1 apolipoprotein N-acyltransferase [Pseudoduganella violacea]
MKQISSSRMLIAAGILASAALAAMYVRGGWLLGFVLLAPWLRTLDASRTWISTLASAYAMSVAFTAAVFAWFGIAFGRYTQIGEVTGLAVLLLCAPLFQPQFFAFALVRHACASRYGPVLRALAAAAAWVAAERLLPRLFNDTLGYGLYPSPLLRQAADVGGGAGLTLLLLLANEGVAAAHARWTVSWRLALRPLALAALAPLLLAGYGAVALSGSPASAAKPLRMGLVQANMVDYEGLRKLKGAHAVVRDVLDRHFAMSYDAVVRQRADAVLWSETAYPTTFGQPKSQAGAEFDREILANVNAAGVPFVFGTYDRDSAGEYNAAAFVQPGTGLLGFYRKTRLFPFTEYVPAWMDGDALRRLLPWTGNWQPGNGARVFPLRLADGREVPVLPLICLDDVDARLAIDGARLGAQAILTMSNDSWFSKEREGAQMHQVAAAFRSIETRLPQFRVTTNGYSAAIDAGGAILAGTAMGEPALVIADLPLRHPAPTLMVRWGDWVGLAASAFLLLLATRSMPIWPRQAGQLPDALPPAIALPASVVLLPPFARFAAGLLRTVARIGLFGMCAALLLDDSLRINTLAQIRIFAACFLAPEAAALCVLFAFRARAEFSHGHLVLSRGAQRIELALQDIAAAEVWRLPFPGPGLALRLASGRRWRYGLALAEPVAFAAAMAGAGGPPIPQKTRELQGAAQAGTGLRHRWLDHPLSKFVLLPLVLAIPAFCLHQHIAYGSALGEYYSFGLKAYLSAFALWWAAWSIGVVLSAALLRAAIEAGALLAVLLRPQQAIGARLWLERSGYVVLYLGLPAWLLIKLSGA